MGNVNGIVYQWYGFGTDNETQGGLGEKLRIYGNENMLKERAGQSAFFCCMKANILLTNNGRRFVLAGREKEEVKQEVGGI